MIRKVANYPIKNCKKRKFKSAYYDEEDFKGYVGLVTIIEMGEFFERTDKDREKDYRGYKWLEFYPENSNVALMVCYTNENKIFDYYFDIIKSIGCEDNNPYFDDLYLDVHMDSDGTMSLLDEDELDEALETSDITQELYDLAKKEAEKLMKRIDGKVDKIAEFTNKYFNKINYIDCVRDEDIGETSNDVEKYRQRCGARGIIVREDGKIAVFNKSLKNEYKLPGGGIENNESPAEAFKREIFEETGCRVHIIEFLGTIEEIKTHDSFKQLSYVFVGRVIEDTKKLHVTKEEKIEGAKILWEETEQALNLITDCFDKLLPSPCEEDLLSVYHTKFMVKRDKKILEYYLKNICV